MVDKHFEIHTVNLLKFLILRPITILPFVKSDILDKCKVISMRFKRNDDVTAILLFDICEGRVNLRGFAVRLFHFAKSCIIFKVHKLLFDIFDRLIVTENPKSLSVEAFIQSI